MLRVLLQKDDFCQRSRTPAGFPLYDAIAACRSELLVFGGHQAAAGLSVDVARIDALRASFDDACRTMRAAGLHEEVAQPIDVALDGKNFVLPLASELARFEPLGAANREPIFLVPDARVEDANAVGEGHLKLALRFGGGRLRCFGWEMASELERIGKHVSVIGTLRPDDWVGGEAVELRLAAIQSQ